MVPNENYKSNSSLWLKNLESKFDCLLNLDQISDTHYQEYEKLYTQREERYIIAEAAAIQWAAQLAISENWRRDFRRWL